MEHSFLVLCLLPTLLLVSRAQQGPVDISPNPTLSVNEGDDAPFSCSGSGPHLLQYNYNITTPSRLTETSNEVSSGDDGNTMISYSLASVTRADNGTTIQCFFNGVASAILTILVDYPPVYTPEMSSYRVVQGSSPRILLELSAFPEVTEFTWRKDNAAIESNERVTLRADGILFSGITADDSGEYVVQAGTGQQATIDITVYHAPLFTEGNDVVNRSVLVDEDITLSCELTAVPSTTDLTLSYDNSQANVNITANSFVIRNAHTGNAGQYTCMAENDVGIRELVFDLNVRASPTVSSSSTTTPSATTVPTVSPSPSGSERLGCTCVMMFLMVVLVMMTVSY